MQLQRRISQWIRNPILRKLRTNGAHNHPLWLRPLNNDTANHHVVTRLHKTTSTNVAQYRIMPRGAEVVHFHKGNSGRVVHTTHDRSVVTRGQVYDHRRFPQVTRCVAASANSGDLVANDNPTDDRRRPVVIRSNQSSSAVVQLQRRISEHIRNAMLGQLRANRSNKDPISTSLNNET